MFLDGVWARQRVPSLLPVVGQLAQAALPRRASSRWTSRGFPGIKPALSEAKRFQKPLENSSNKAKTHQIPFPKATSSTPHGLPPYRRPGALGGEEGVDVAALRQEAWEVQEPQLLTLFEPEVHEPQGRGGVLHVPVRQRAARLPEAHTPALGRS